MAIGQGKELRSLFVSMALSSLAFTPRLDGDSLAAADQSSGIPLDEVAAPVAHPDIFTASTGAPQDSLVLRISIGFRYQEKSGYPFITIEEIVSPLPVLYQIEIPGYQKAEMPEPQDMVNVYEVDGREFLDQLCSAGSCRFPAWLPRCFWNLKFGSWLSPRAFSLSVNANSQISALISRQPDGSYRAATIDGETSFTLRTQPLDALIMPAEVLHMVTGQPAQSLVLRVSVTRAPTRCESVQSVIIEELGWPPPGLVIARGSGHDPQKQEYYKTHSRWLRAGRISQNTLGEIWHTVPRQPKMLWSHHMKLLEFRAWLSPSTFALGSTEMGLVIKRGAEGRYLFVEGVGNYMIEPQAD